ncbi:MAG: protein kinase [Myxococcaceae bacterium]|nr:protein kinase [Myxococcaceae bacterium]
MDDPKVTPFRPADADDDLGDTSASQRQGVERPNVTPYRSDPAPDELGDTAASGNPRESAPRHTGEKIGRFLVIEKVGEGGMGAVYAAHDPMLNRKVALKLLRRELSHASYGARMMREAQALAKLSHPNVVNVHDVGMSDGRMFLAMEHIEGAALSEVLRDPQPWTKVLALFLEAGRGLAAAHNAGLIHRDFKPQNAMVGRDGRVRVLDFGLARDASEDARPEAEAAGAVDLASPLTRTGALMGTPLYMAPEQFEAAACDARTDQFSFCVSLWEGLYGERPFAGLTLEELKRAVLTRTLRPIPRGRKVPAKVHQALVRGLSPARADRFPSMEALLQVLTPRSRRWSIALVVALGAVSLPLGGFAILQTVRNNNPKLWFDDHRKFCNPLQVTRALQNSPPPEEPLGQAFAAGCLAIAGKLSEADATIAAMPLQSDREAAAEILYALGDSTENKTHDYAAGAPLFALAFKHAPNNHQYVYYLAFGELELGKRQEAREHLELFLKLFDRRSVHEQAQLEAYRRSAAEALEGLKASP